MSGTNSPGTNSPGTNSPGTNSPGTASLGTSSSRRPSDDNALRTGPEIRLAERLAAARGTATAIADLDPALVPATPADGYRIAWDVAGRLGWPRLGWKIAGTTEAVRAKLGIDQPIYGPTYQRFLVPSPARLPHRELLDPLVECEFFVRLGRDLPASEAPWSREAVVDAVDGVFAGIEVAECRFPMAKLPPLPAILADGAASGRYVIGDAIAGWRDGLSDVAVVLSVDGVERRFGHGHEVMGDPLTPLVWLAETLRQRGIGLTAGEIVSTGSTTGMFPVKQGQEIVARYGRDAKVEIAFDE